MTRTRRLILVGLDPGSPSGMGIASGRKKTPQAGGDLPGSETSRGQTYFQFT